MTSRRILLVDDSPEFLRSAEHFLSAVPGFEVVGSAPSGKDAINQVDRLRPDLVLMDVAMPGMNGLEATRQIKSALESPRVILVTMHDGPEYRAAAAAAGADGFLAKPEFGACLLPLLESFFEDPPGVARSDLGPSPHPNR